MKVKNKQEAHVVHALFATSVIGIAENTTFIIHICISSTFNEYISDGDRGNNI